MWALPGQDSIRLLYAGSALPADAQLLFMDPDTCALLATATDLPAQARVGLNFIDPTYAVTVVADDGRSDRQVLPAAGTGQCLSGPSPG